MNAPVNNLRKLSNAELELVSGGQNTIYVDGDRWGWEYDPWAFLNDMFSGYQQDYTSGDGSGGSSGGGGEEDHSLAEATEAALEITEAKHNVIKDLVEKYGRGGQIQLPNGEITTLGNLLDNIGRVTGVLQAGLTIAEVLDGGKDLHDAINFVFGVTVTAMAAEAGAGAVFAGALGFAAEYAAGHILDWMEKMGDLNRALGDYFNAEIAEWVQNNSDVPEGTYQTPRDAIWGMFGWPRYDGYDIP